MAVPGGKAQVCVRAAQSQRGPDLQQRTLLGPERNLQLSKHSNVTHHGVRPAPNPGRRQGGQHPGGGNLTSPSNSLLSQSAAS